MQALDFRTVALLGLFTFGMSACAADAGAIPAAEESATPETSSEISIAVASGGVKDVLLVHGAWADGSSWSEVIRHLQRGGFNVQAVQLAEQSVADDAQLVRHAIGAIPRRVVVGAHSYGGFVMSEATADAANVAALVFVAAFAPDENETLASVSAGYPTTPVLANLTVDDQGNATIAPDVFVRHFASDVPERDARVLAAVQHPIAVSILQEVAGKPGWKTIPSYYSVSRHDEVIDPNLERFFAERMGAHTIELKASHVSLISRSRTIASLIARAAAGR